MHKRRLFLLLAIALFIFLAALACSSGAGPDRETAEAEEAEPEAAPDRDTHTQPAPEPEEEKEAALMIAGIQGLDEKGAVSALKQGVLEGNFGTVAVFLDAENFNHEEDEVLLVWSHEGSEVYRDHTIVKEPTGQYTGGMQPKQGFLPGGTYSCQVKLNGKEADRIDFEIVQPDPEPIEISGEGTASTDFFDLAGGLTVFTLSHQGSGNFIVYLMDQEGHKLELMANEIGSVEARKAMHLPRGRYFFNVEHGSQWQVSVDQPRSQEAHALPYRFEGSQPDISDLLLLDGLVEFAFSHQGEGNFIVYLLTGQGRREKLMVNEIGPTSGNTAFGTDGAAYLIAVEAAGGDYILSLDYK